MTAQDIDRLAVRFFSWSAIAEAATWVGLLIGMWFKHVAKTTDWGVTTFGPLHGAVFVVYCVAAVLVAWRLRWPVLRATLPALAAAIPPFATVLFTRWAGHQGYLTWSDRRQATHPPAAR